MSPELFTFDRFLPLLDPDTFSDVAFYQELEKIGYRQVLLGGTGSAGLTDVVRAIRGATNIMRQGLPFVPVAYLIMGNSTARWYFDAFLLPSNKILLGYANYARMVGYRFLALDYEDPEINIDAGLIAALRKIPGLHLVISDEFTPEGAAAALGYGAQTVITPSDIFEDAADPLALAAEFHDRLLKRP